MAANLSVACGGSNTNPTTPGGATGNDVFTAFVTGADGAVSSFTTPLSGAAGSLIATSLAGTQIAGTFQAVVPATPPETGMTQTVRGGALNVPVAGGFVPATPANPGSTITATLNGTSFVAGTVAGAVSGSGFSLNAIATSAAGATSSIAFVFLQTSVGTYPWFSTTGPAVTVTVVVDGASYGGGTTGDTGSVTITSDSVAGVVQGSFSDTLTGGLTIADGQFTIKRPPGSSARRP